MSVAVAAVGSVAGYALVRSRDFVAAGAGADVGGGALDGRGVALVPLDVEQGNDLAAL